MKRSAWAMTVVAIVVILLLLFVIYPGITGDSILFFDGVERPLIMDSSGQAVFSMSEATEFGIPKGTTVIKENIKRDFSESTFINVSYGGVYSLSFTGKVTVADEGMVRLISVDSSGNEYLILDSNFLAPNKRVSFKNYCEESCALNNVTIVAIKVQVENAQLSLSKFYLNKEVKSKLKDKDKQNEIKITSVNKNNQKEGKEWVAGETPLSKLSYSEKKELFYEVDKGKKIKVKELPNLKGLEYYQYGSFNRPIADNIMIDTSGVCINYSEYCESEPREDFSGGAYWFHPFVSPGYSESGAVINQTGGGEVADAGGGRVISNVPAYLWHDGCGPTSVGMVVGYYDSIGYADLVSGDVGTQVEATNHNEAVNVVMASLEHYNDYSLPRDTSSTGLLQDKSQLGGAHASNCIADFMKTSWSSVGNYYGWSWLSDVDDSFEGYTHYVGYSASDSYTKSWSFMNWEMFTGEIDSGRPLLFLVDTNANGGTDHFVTVIGYRTVDGVQQYAAYNTWDRNVHWYGFNQMASGVSWGVYGAIFFDMGEVPTGAVVPAPMPVTPPEENETQENQTQTTTFPNVCWGGDNQYLVNSDVQKKKFCLCAMGTYGYNSKSTKSGTFMSYQYTDSGENENWEVSSLYYKSPVYQVKCKDGIWHSASTTYNITAVSPSPAPETPSSCTEHWNCTNWSSCVENQQTRVCMDLSDCGTEIDKPEELWACTSPESPSEENETQAFCWSGNNQYLENDKSQAKKFCLCAMGTYGFVSKNRLSVGSVDAYQYSDKSESQEWDTVLLSSYYHPVYQVKCKDEIWHDTNRDY